ncbi:hypothetical protein L195_g063576, partial [Trifolium pratense]
MDRDFLEEGDVWRFRCLKEWMRMGGWFGSEILAHSCFDVEPDASPL